MDRYLKNKQSITESEQKKLYNSKVCVIGCGGIGGYAIELLARIGIGNIIVIDKDVFEISNLNRQLFCTEKNIGKSKAQEAAARISQINSEIKIEGMHLELNIDNALELLSGANIVIDALDNIATRFILQDCCNKLNIPLVYGAIAGFYGQVSTIFPFDNTLERIYTSKEQVSIEKQLGNLACIPSIVAAVEVTEVIKILLNRDNLLRNKLLYIDLLDNEYTIISFKNQH